MEGEGGGGQDTRAKTQEVDMGGVCPSPLG